MKILVCEDEKISHGWLVKMIKSWGYNTISAYTGAEAIRRANEDLPNVILLDMLYPDMEGIEVLKEIRGNSDLDSTEVITASATAADELAPQLKDLRVRASLDKPIKKAELKQLLDEISGTAENNVQEASSFLTVTKNSVHQKVLDKLILDLNSKPLSVDTIESAEKLLASVKITGLIIDTDADSKQIIGELQKLTSVIPRRTPIILETATVDQAEIQELFKYGVVDILVKPVNMNRIKESIQKVLGRALEAQEEQRGNTQKTLLIVEDFSITANMLSRLFAKTDLKTFIARTGPDAFELIVKKKPNLMLLDLNLPGMNGLELLKLLESKGLTMPFAVSTAERDEAKLRILKKMGALKIFKKPLVGEELIGFMRSFNFEKGTVDRDRCTYDVLLAASDDSIIGVAEDAMQQAEILYQMVTDSTQALAEMKGRPPVLVLDMGLKGKDIRELIKQVRTSKQNESLKIIGLAEKLDASLRGELTALGVDAILSKPISTGKLTKQIQEMLSTLPPSVDMSEFTGEFLKELDKLPAVQDSGYFDQAKRLGHNLAGTAGLISSKELHDAGTKLEDAASQKLGEECQKQLQQIRKLIEQLAAKATLMK